MKKNDNPSVLLNPAAGLQFCWLPDVIICGQDSVAAYGIAYLIKRSYPSLSVRYTPHPEMLTSLLRSETRLLIGVSSGYLFTAALLRGVYKNGRSPAPFLLFHDTGETILSSLLPGAQTVDLRSPLDTVVQKLLTALRHSRPSSVKEWALPDLPGRQKQILCLLMKRHSHAVIARYMNLHVKTVSHYRCAILRNLGGRSQLAFILMLADLVKPGTGIRYIKTQK